MNTIGRSSDSKSRKSPPEPSYMSNDQFAKYLAELRSNRVSRPGGARPQPAGARPAPSRASTILTSEPFTSDDSVRSDSHSSPKRWSSQSIGSASVASRFSTSSLRSQDYYPTSPTKPLKPSEVVPTATYMERGQRWMEKEEAGSLREAMAEMDLRDKEPPKESSDEENRIYQAALDEAAELVWQHQHGRPLPEPNGPYRYRPHLRKDSYAHARTASASSLRDETDPSASQSVSGSSTDSEGNRRPSEDSKHSKSTERLNRVSKNYGSGSSRPGPSPVHRRRSSLKRNISGEILRPFSGDQIWEEPESASSKPSVSSGRASPEKLSSRAQNPVSRLRFGSQADSGKSKSLERVEIQRNPPTQSRNPLYTSNSTSETPPPDDRVEKKNGMEIRGEDIRQATSMRLKNRSSRLPEPTAVSDSPGRPIVSFDANWKAPDEATDTNPDRSSTAPSNSSSRFQSGPKQVEIPSIVVAEENAPKPRASAGANVPSISIAGPDDKPSGAIPQINVPTIAVDEAPKNPSIPSIVTPDDKPARGGRPLPTPGAKGTRKLPRPQGHWSPAPGATGRVTAICHECGFPIEGRFVALAGCSERFHPQCFACFTCGTSLEAMEISPEPDQVRAERFARIRRRAAGEIIDEEPGKTAAEDGDERLRFFCHLDWHELYAPRCKHCKTPILGEHIVALGQHWHYGHFFCAECGDPFEHGMTHIEKDGYAWCINCQTKRTERRAPKCKKCRTAVIGQYIQALGGEWHEHCFRCNECNGGFDDGQIFPKDTGRGMIVLCTACRAMELKM